MAAVGLFAGVFSLLIYLCIILVPVALLVVLQVWLCKKSIRLGLILPGVSLVMSLILAFGVIAFSSLSTAGASGELVLEQNGQVVERTVTENGTVTVYDGEGNITNQYPDPNYEDNRAESEQISLTMIAVAGVMFLVFNIPTLVFGGIWLHYKNRRDLQDDLRKMKVEDLG